MKHMITLTFAILFTSAAYAEDKVPTTTAQELKCVFDSSKTATTEMYLGLNKENLGKEVIKQAIVIDASSGKKHIHVVFLKGTDEPTFKEKATYSLSGEYRVLNPTKDGKLRKHPIANYRYFVASSWKILSEEKGGSANQVPEDTARKLADSQH